MCSCIVLGQLRVSDSFGPVLCCPCQLHVGIQRMEPRELHDMRRGLCIGIYNYEYKIIEINCHADPYCP